MEQNIYVETINEEGEVINNQEGNIIITTLKNHTMPFIRYKVGDKGKIVTDYICQCGNHSSILELTTGRISDYAILKDGSKVNSYVFVRAIEMVNKLCENIILQFQIVQKDYDYFCVNLILDEVIIDEGIGEREVEDMFLKNVKDERLFDTEFEFEYFDEFLPDVNSEKIKYFKKNHIGSRNLEPSN